MNTKQLIKRTAVTFTALALAGMSVIFTAQFIPDAYGQNTLVAVGSAIFGASLAFFLVRVFALNEK